MTEQILGKLHLGAGKSGDMVTLERLLPGPIERVWAYLAEPKHRSRWLAGGDIELEVGGALNLDFDLIECPGRENMHGTVVGIVTELDPPNRLSFSWNENGEAADASADSLITFELVAVGPKLTKLILTHTRIRREELSGIAAGWHVHLDVLASRLRNLEPAHFEAAWALLDQQYRGQY